MADPEQEKTVVQKGRRKLQIPDKVLNLIGQAIAAAAVIGTNQATLKAEVAPIKMEQTLLNIKVTGLSEKVGRIEKQIGTGE